MSNLTETEAWLLENDAHFFDNIADDYTDAFDILFVETDEPILEYYFDALPHMSFEAFAEEFGYQPE